MLVPRVPSAEYIQFQCSYVAIPSTENPDLVNTERADRAHELLVDLEAGVSSVVNLLRAEEIALAGRAAR